MNSIEAPNQSRSADPHNPSSSSFFRAHLPQLLIILSAVLALWPLCMADFTSWDDWKTVSQNPTLNPPTLHSLWVWWTGSNLDLWDPATDMVRGTLALIGTNQSPDPVTGSKLNPYVYHSANLLIHIAAALVVYQILVLLLARRTGFSRSCEDKKGLKPALQTIRWAAAAGAILFAVHPLQVESVGWVTAMKDLLCGLFSLAAIWRYLIYVSGREISNSKHRTPNQSQNSKFKSQTGFEFWIATLLFVLATLSKPTAVVVPAIIVVINWIILQRPARMYLRGMSLWAILAAPCIIITSRVQDASYLGPVVVWKRLLVAADALAFYLYKLVWPAHLTFDYGRTTHLVFDRGFAYWTWSVPMAIALVLWIFRKRCPAVVAGALIFLLGLLPVLGFVGFDLQQYSNVADHYLYLSMFGVALAAAAMLQTIPFRLAMWCAALTLTTMGARAWFATWPWQTSETLYRHALDVNPRSFVSSENLAVLALLHNNADEAIGFARESIRSKPEAYNAYTTLGDALTRAGRIPEATEQYRIALSLNPDDPKVLHDLGRNLAYRRRYEEALAYLRRACDLDPVSAVSHRDLAVILMKMSRFDEAIPAFRDAIRLEPDNADLHARLSMLLLKVGRAEEARREHEAAVQLKAASQSASRESSEKNSKEQP